ncbi:DUF2929 family protein [Granulicatella sp. zg-ZJ]|uniref:DUF2929 family protein n=1 Tax=unclassified Granulicatella TaxID=2630493 RepID=UPI0013BF7B57|nr:MULTISPECIES: DUF2929 family protein [unclassified Granulicatella]MBS4750550.1 DUF2929 family protein [Carnobacteriaceae bacterium zg-ZUI78]NEW63452.1 DUF2929 family protein [Granulicatella sp. zg-ZJ]NEW66717.1 DUF2929 family protein [Granulicatella sp. zg-84]QMI85304.1 DUF2929 family protein [Carnobacteriaceae bacterium zg-84]
MKVVITFFWAFLITQVTFFLGASLSGMQYHFSHATALAVAATLSVIIITKMLPPIQKAEKSHEVSH